MRMFPSIMISRVFTLSFSASSRRVFGGLAHLPSTEMVGVRCMSDSSCNVHSLWSFAVEIQANAMSDQKLNIVCYLKTYCGWSEGVRAIMRKYELAFDEKDIIKNPAYRWEMEQKSGQPLSPCVQVNEHMLADVSGDEVELYLVENGLVEARAVAPDAPTDSSCVDH